MIPNTDRKRTRVLPMHIPQSCRCRPTLQLFFVTYRPFSEFTRTLWTGCPKIDPLWTRDLHGDGDGGNTTESAGNPREWIQLLREYRGMESAAAGNPRGVFGKSTTMRFSVLNS